jgi:hypothetical protein
VGSTSDTRWRLACDACGVEAWIGPANGGAYDTWCEGCQRAERRDRAPADGDACTRCGAPLAAAPRFVELWGELQHLDAVLAAWAGDPSALVAILPERPRFLSDLDPPAPGVGDPAERAAALGALKSGEWQVTLRDRADPDTRMHAARAIAFERLGDLAAAQEEWDALLANCEDPRARLARGALRARRGSFEQAAEDLGLAGTSFEARWNRAACLLHLAVRDSEGLPAPELLARARAEAGEPSAYWSDPTVGRLLWSLLVERELARAGGSHARLADGARRTLRAAEAQFEHATFWDRAMMVAGWARLGAFDECGRNAAPLVRELAAELLREPALTGARLQDLAETVDAAGEAAARDDAAAAHKAIAPALAREDLRHFRIPCAACGRGAVGVEETAEVAGVEG